MTGALRSGASTTRRPFGSVRRSTGYLVAGIRIPALRADTLATLTGRRGPHSSRRANGVQRRVDHPVVVAMGAGDRHVQHGGLGPADVDERDPHQLVGGLQPLLVEVHAERAHPGRPPTPASAVGGGHSLASSGRVSDGPLASRRGPVPVMIMASTTTRPITTTARAPPPNQRSIIRLRRAGSSSSGGALAGGIGGGGGASRVTVPDR